MAAIEVDKVHKGNVTPSKHDVEITRKLKAAGETIGTKVLEYIIFNQKGY